MNCSLYCIAESNGMDARPCKIGMSANVKGRLHSVQGGNWRPLYIIWTIPMPWDIAKQIEWSALARFRPSIFTGNESDRLKSEWVDASAQDILDYVKQRYDVETVVA